MATHAPRLLVLALFLAISAPVWCAFNYSSRGEGELIVLTVLATVVGAPRPKCPNGYTVHVGHMQGIALLVMMFDVYAMIHACQIHGQTCQANAQPYDPSAQLAAHTMHP
jgi:hypothetical protein